MDYIQRYKRTERPRDMDSINRILTGDYMGSSEFEFGTCQRAWKWMRLNHANMALGVINVMGKMDDGSFRPVTFYTVASVAMMDRLHLLIQHLASGAHHNCCENPYVDYAIMPATVKTIFNEWNAWLMVNSVVNGTVENVKLGDSPSFFTLDRKLAIRVIMELGRDKTAKRCFAVGDSIYTAPNDHSSKIVIVEGDVVVIRRHGRSRRFHVNDVYTPQEFGKITRLLPR